MTPDDEAIMARTVARAQHLLSHLIDSAVFRCPPPPGEHRMVILATMGMSAQELQQVDWNPRRANHPAELRPARKSPLAPCRSRAGERPAPIPRGGSREPGGHR